MFHNLLVGGLQMRQMKIVRLCMLIIAGVVASIALHASITHNPMDVFCIERDSCDFDYVYALFIWFSWFLSTSIPLVIVATMAKYIKKIYQAF